MRYLIVFMLLCGTCYAGTELKNNKLYINQEIFDSFERCNYVDGDKVWHTAMLSQRQGFFNSIWLTDEEYGRLRGENKCTTTYKGETIEVIMSDPLYGKNYLELLRRINKLEDDIDKIHSMIADLEIKFMGVKRYEQICPKARNQ